jgi:predicted aminopeptidase
LKSQWGGFAGYDTWMARDLNNAQLNTIANYYDYLPGFEQLLKRNNGDMEKFYQAVERLAKMSKEKRHQSLRDLAKGEGSLP